MKISDTSFFKNNPFILQTHLFLWEKSEPPILEKFWKLKPPFLKGERGSIYIYLVQYIASLKIFVTVKLSFASKCLGHIRVVLKCDPQIVYYELLSNSTFASNFCLISLIHIYKSV